MKQDCWLVVIDIRGWCVQTQSQWPVLPVFRYILNSYSVIVMLPPDLWWCCLYTGAQAGFGAQSLKSPIRPLLIQITLKQRYTVNGTCHPLTTPRWALMKSSALWSSDKTRDKGRAPRPPTILPQSPLLFSLAQCTHTAGHKYHCFLGPERSNWLSYKATHTGDIMTALTAVGSWG